MDLPSKPQPKASNSNPWLIISIVLAIALIALIAFTFSQKAKDAEESAKLTTISAEQASDKLMNFINELYSAQVGEVTLKETTEKNGLYHVNLIIQENGQPVDQLIFITQDGEYFIPQIVEIESTLNEFRNFQAQQPPGDQVQIDPNIADTPPVE